MIYLIFVILYGFWPQIFTEFEWILVSMIYLMMLLTNIDNTIKKEKEK